MALVGTLRTFGAAASLTSATRAIGISMSLEIRLAQPRDFPAIGRMLELYQYELSDIWDQELDSQGEYRYDLSKHQIGKQFFAYVLLVNSSYAGLALVAPAMVTRKEGCWMEQFFVLKKHRKGGNGQALASYVFKAHPGFWEVGQMPANAAARQFWLRIIDQATSGKFEEVVVQQGWWQGTVQRFSVDVAV